MSSPSLLGLPLGVRGQFSGHETFPLRQLWLPKIADFINKARKNNRNADFTSVSGIDSAMRELGLGKNMVASARFWARASGVITEQDELTPFGILLFGDDKNLARDPYCTNSASIWLVHWNLARKMGAFTPIWYLFNCVNQPTLDRQSFVVGMKDLCRKCGWKVSDLTLRRAQECTLRAYLPGLSAKGYTEDFVEPLLSELGLLELTASRDVFLIHRGPHHTLPDEVFIYALMQFWLDLDSQASSLDFSRIALDYGSPGRVFKLDGDSVARRLQRLEEITNGNLEWTEQAGLRQVVRRGSALNAPHKFARKVLLKCYDL